MKVVIALIILGFIGLCVREYNHKKEIERIKYAEAKNFFIEKELNELYEKEFLNISDIHVCTTDCSGHIAGFEWAKSNDVWKHEKCVGYSNSFVEGCRIFVDEIKDIFNNTENRVGFDDYIADFLDESIYYLE